MSSDRPSTITADTRIPLGIVWTMLGTAIVGTVAAVGIYNQLRTLNDTVRAMNANGWTLQDQSFWSLQFGSDNPSLKVPVPRKVSPVPFEPQEGK